MNRLSQIVGICFILFLIPYHYVSGQASDQLSTLKEKIESSSVEGMSIYASSSGEDTIRIEKGAFASERNYTHNIASVSKTFIGISLMQLQEKGKLSLDDDVNDILPFKITNPKYKDLTITIRHLATHTSGINDRDIEKQAFYMQEDYRPYKKGMGKDACKTYKKWAENSQVSLARFLPQVFNKGGQNYHKKRFFKSKPGQEFHYSNLGAALSAYIVEIVAGQSYESYVEEHILNPLGMSNTTWNHLSSTDRSCGFFENGTKVPVYASILFPAGGMNSSKDDLMVYLDEIVKGSQGSGTLINPDSYQVMLSPQLKKGTKQGDKNQGIFWEINGNFIGHNGGNYGVIILMGFDNESGKRKFLFSNQSSYQEGDVLKEMVEIWKLM